MEESSRTEELHSFKLAEGYNTGPAKVAIVQVLKECEAEYQARAITITYGACQWGVPWRELPAGCQWRPLRAGARWHRPLPAWTFPQGRGGAC
jgi:hypothetical protein